MAKGKKMREALFKVEEDKYSIKSIDGISKENNGSLFCADRCCLVAIEYNSGYKLNASSKTVAPYLKLAKHKEHKAGCKNSVSGAVKAIVDESSSVEDAPQVFIKSQDSVTFRLNLLESPEAKSTTSQPIGGITNNDNGNSKGTDFASTGRKIASYFRSAAGIAKLRAMLDEADDQAELANLVRIQFKDKYIDWSDFYFDESNFGTLFRKVEAGLINHPVAVNLQPKNLKSSQSSYYPWTIQSYAHNTEKKSFVPWIKLHSSLDGNSIELEHDYIVLGRPEAHVNKTENREYRNITFKVKNKHQIFKLK